MTWLKLLRGMLYISSLIVLMSPLCKGDCNNTPFDSTKCLNYEQDIIGTPRSTHSELFFDTTGISHFSNMDSIVHDFNNWDRLFTKSGYFISFRRSGKYVFQLHDGEITLDDIRPEFDSIRTQFEQIQSIYGNFTINRVYKLPIGGPLYDTIDKQVFILTFENNVNIFDVVACLEQISYCEVDFADYPSRPVNSINNLQFQFQIHPNPAKEKLTIKLLELLDLQQNYSILDLNGNVIFKGDVPLGAEQFDINLSNLVSGTYFLQIGSSQAKFIKE